MDDEKDLIEEPEAHAKAYFNKLKWDDPRVPEQLALGAGDFMEESIGREWVMVEALAFSAIPMIVAAGREAGVSEELIKKAGTALLNRVTTRINGETFGLQTEKEAPLSSKELCNATAFNCEEEVAAVIKEACADLPEKSLIQAAVKSYALQLIDRLYRVRLGVLSVRRVFLLDPRAVEKATTQVNKVLEDYGADHKKEWSMVVANMESFMAKAKLPEGLVSIVSECNKQYTHLVDAGIDPVDAFFESMTVMSRKRKHEPVPDTAETDKADKSERKTFDFKIGLN